MKKKMILSFVTAILLFSTLPISQTVVKADMGQSRVGLITKEAELKNNLSEKGYQEYLKSKDKIPNANSRSLKTKALAKAIRSGGKVISNVLEYLTPSVGKTFKKYSGEIANILDRIDGNINAQLVSGMISLGIPSSTARTIAWVLTTFFL